MQIKRGNTVIADVYLKENSYTVEEVMGEHTLTLNFLSRNVVDLQINDTVDFEGNTYKIRHNEKVTKRETSLGWEYNVTLYSSRYDLQDVQFFLHGTPERKKNFDYYTGTARDWLNLFVKNMNRTGSGWIVGSCIESRMITLSFKDKKVGSVLDELIKELDTEYWISGKTISIGKREYSSNGLILGQGEGMGFTELEVSAVDDTPPVTVLYPYGSDKNLGMDYGSDYLLLPGGVLSLEKNVDKYGRIEQSVQFDHIFPQGEFTVTEKIDSLTLKSDIEFNLKECLLDDVEVIVTFQDGGLAGYDLAIVKESVDDAAKQFKLKENKEENALTVPGDIHFSVGDKFILTGLKMPKSYIDKASNQLLNEAQSWLDSKCEKRIQLRGKCDEVVFRLQNLFIACGQMVGVYSEQLKIDREIRVTRVKRFIENDNKPCYRYELTLSDFLQSNDFKDMVDDVNKVPEEIEDKVKPVREYSKRSWRDVKETQDMMFDPDGSFQTEFTSALMAEFAHLLVGSKSQQMDLMGIKFIPNADNDPNYFKSTAGKLVHFTIRESIAEWTIPSSAHRLSNSIAYYVYAKCSRTTSNGSIYVTDRKIKLEEDPEYYHFWIGVLNTPEDGVRSWGPLYGYTEIAGQTITTGVIKDKLARLVIDLVNGTITGPVTFKSGSSGYNNITDRPNLQPIYDGVNDALTDAENASNTANNAQSSANSAQNTANSKSTVYYSQPYSGMKVNDLWVNGTDIRRWNGSSWEFASKYDNTETRIIGGLVTTGAVAVGPSGNPTGGIAGSGSVRIWAGGGCNADGIPISPTFAVEKDGTVTAQKAIKLRDGQAGISGDGTSASSIRIWAGDSNPSIAPFRVTQNGEAYMSKGIIGSFSISNGCLTSNAGAYMDLNYGLTHIKMGPNLYPETTAGYTGVMSIKNAQNNYGNADYGIYNSNTALELRVQGSDINYLVKGKSADTGEMSMYFRHLPGDVAWLHRSCLKLSKLPLGSQVNAIGGAGGNKYNVGWDENTGLLYIIQ